MKGIKSLAICVVILLCLCACSARGDDMRSEASGAPSQGREVPELSEPTGAQSLPSAESDGTEPVTDLPAEDGMGTPLSLEEIRTIFQDLDAEVDEMLDWVQKDYTQVPTAGVPIHEIEDAVIDVKWASTSPESPDAGGFKPVYGTAVFAKVTEETLPGFPWGSVDEISAAIARVYHSPSESFGLEELICADPAQPEGIFFQFDDGLYFRTDYIGTVRDIFWDYASIHILQHGSDEIHVQIYEKGADSASSPDQRGIVRNEDGEWVLTAIKWGA